MSATHASSDMPDQSAAQPDMERFFDLSLNLLCIAGVDGYFKRLNPAWQSVFGYTENELLAIPFLEFVHPEDREPTLAVVAQLSAGETVVAFTNRLRAKDGSYKWLEWQSSADMSQQLMYSSARDITTQKRATERTRLFEALVENAPDGFALADPDGILTYLNPAFRAMLGYASTPAGTRMALLHTPADQQRVPAIIERARLDGAWQGIMSYQRQDGTTFDAQLSMFLVRDADGTPLAQVKIARDITAQQQIEQERQALQDQIIDAQQTALRELSTPLIPITDDVVVMPLVGALDSRRAQQILDTLLQGIESQRAATAILDITGVPIVDTQVANSLLQAAQAAKLLGAQVILTGIRPEVAQTLVGLGVDIRGIVTHSNLQNGIAYAVAQHR